MPKPCSYEGCEKLTRSRGLCGGHYRQWSKGQDLRPLRPMRKPYASLEEGFFADVRESATGCWDWVGATTPGGYGIFWKSGGAVMAHRWAYEFLRTTMWRGETQRRCRACHKIQSRRANRKAAA